MMIDNDDDDDSWARVTFKECIYDCVDLMIVYN